MDSVLEKTELKFEELVELAIMSGTDYNKNIPQLGIGRAYPLIKKYGNIDNLPKKYDTECLKHNVCRKLFEYVDSESITVEGFLDYNPALYAKQGNDIMYEEGLEEFIEANPNYMNNVPWVRVTSSYNRVLKHIFYKEREKPTDFSIFESDDEKSEKEDNDEDKEEEEEEEEL